MAIFSPWVALKVKITFSGLSTSNNSAASIRQWKAVSSAAREAGWSPRPGELMPLIAQAAARRTCIGFSSVVAAASK